MIFVPLFFFYFLWYASLRFVFRDQDKVLLNTYASRALQVVALGVLAYGYFGFGISLSAQYLTQVCFGFFSCLGGTYIPVTPLTAWYLGLLSGSFFMTIVSLFFQFFEILSRNLERRLSTRSKCDGTLFWKLYSSYTRNFTLRLFGSLLIFFGILYMALTAYGTYRMSSPENCPYMERDVPLPQELLGAMIILDRDAYVGIGHEAGYACLVRMGGVDHLIISPDDVLMKSKSEYYSRVGFNSVAVLPKGKRFSIADAIRVSSRDVRLTSHGRDEGRYFMVLTDEGGASYLVDLSAQGIGWKDSEFMSLHTKTGNQERTQVLRNENFIFHPDSLEYTGK